MHNVPAPTGDPKAPLQALIFDSQYDAYRGCRRLLPRHGRHADPGQDREDDGLRRRVQPGGDAAICCPPSWSLARRLCAGEVGYLTACIKNVKDTQVGDTITTVENPADEPLPGYRPARPMVYCGIYTEDGSKYPDLRDALEKLQLNDASLSFEPETSVALGFGFRCGFLGMLHMEIIQERLEREFDLDLVTTLPTVIYEVTKTDGTMVQVDNPHNYPDPARHPSTPRSPMSRSPSSLPRSTWATSCPCARSAGASSRTCSIWTPTWWSCTIRCP